MTPAKTWSFKDYCTDEQIVFKDSSLGREILQLETVDFHRLWGSKANVLGRPIHIMKVGRSSVLHFYLEKFEKDVFLETDESVVFELFEELNQKVEISQ